MAMLTRTILTGVLFLFPFISTAYPASLGKTEPIAQVYDVQGRITVKSSADNSVMDVRKGCLLGPEDSLTLDKDASIAMYFKNGGRKEIRAKDTQVLYKVADLLPKAEAYSQNVPLFGATRGAFTPKEASQAANFFYPQEGIILDDQPLIEVTLFNGAGGDVAPGGVAVRILKNGVVLDSREFNMEYGFPCVYEPAKLAGETEYSVELRLGFQKSLGNVVTISFPLYIAGISDTASVSKYAPFSDQVYRSFESTTMDYKGKKRTITVLKQLVRRGAPPQPVIAIELFIS